MASPMQQRIKAAADGVRSYLVGAPLSSIIHGQKFCGLRVVAAFLITVIFMILTFCLGIWPMGR